MRVTLRCGIAIALLSLIPVRNWTLKFVACVPSSPAVSILLFLFVYKIRPFSQLLWMKFQSIA